MPAILPQFLRVEQLHSSYRTKKNVAVSRRKFEPFYGWTLMGTTEAVIDEALEMVLPWWMEQLQTSGLTSPFKNMSSSEAPNSPI